MVAVSKLGWAIIAAVVLALTATYFRPLWIVVGLVILIFMLNAVGR